nr:MAG TPA: hypothetical protein [Bacteriophage sp.]
MNCSDVIFNFPFLVSTNFLLIAINSLIYKKVVSLNLLPI